MEFESDVNRPGAEQQEYVGWLCSAVRAFDPAKAAGSWEPNNGELVAELNRLAETLQKKSAEIKQHIRTITIEELNDLDGFGRCNVLPSATGTVAVEPPVK